MKICAAKSGQVKNKPKNKIAVRNTAIKSTTKWQKKKPDIHFQIHESQSCYFLSCLMSLIPIKNS